MEWGILHQTAGTTATKYTCLGTVLKYKFVVPVFYLSTSF